MQNKRLKIKERHILIVRSAAITFFILSSGIIAIVCMGRAYSVIQKTAFGNTAAFFDMRETDVYTFFGYEFHFPLIYYCKKVTHFLELYSPGIIKLLGYILDVIKESWRFIIKLL